MISPTGDRVRIFGIPVTPATATRSPSPRTAPSGSPTTSRPVASTTSIRTATRCSRGTRAAASSRSRRASPSTRRATSTSPSRARTASRRWTRTVTGLPSGARPASSPTSRASRSTPTAATSTRPRTAASRRSTAPATPPGPPVPRAAPRGEFVGVNTIAVAADGSVYTTEPGTNHRVQKSRLLRPLRRGQRERRHERAVCRDRPRRHGLRPRPGRERGRPLRLGPREGDRVRLHASLASRGALQPVRRRHRRRRQHRGRRPEQARVLALQGRRDVRLVHAVQPGSGRRRRSRRQLLGRRLRQHRPLRRERHADRNDHLVDR